MSSNYSDTSSFVGGNGKSDEYTMLQNYTMSGNSQAAPFQSALKMTVPSASQKYFSITPVFQERIDNFRIAPPSMTPIGLTSDSTCSSQNSSVAAATTDVTGTTTGQTFASSGEYARLGQTYKLNPY